MSDVSPLLISDFSEFSEFSGSSDPLITYSIINRKKVKTPNEVFDFSETNSSESNKIMQRCCNIIVIGILTFFFIFIIFYVLHSILHLV